jgi:hypothetical protein
MPSTMILERVGWERCSSNGSSSCGSCSSPADPASRPEYQPGEVAQCDLWFPPVDTDFALQ